jgi:serine protease AprX
MTSLIKKSASQLSHTFFCCLISIAWLLGTSQAPPPAQIDPRVLEDTADGKIAHFLVVFEQQMSLPASQRRGITDDIQAGRLVAGLRSAATKSQVTARVYLEEHNIRYHAYWVANVIAVEGNRQTITDLARYPEVASIEADRSFSVDLEVEATGIEELSSLAAPEGIEPGLAQVHAPLVWGRGEIGNGMVYAVADTGIYWQHEALINQYRGSNGVGAIHDYNWWDAIHSDINGAPNPCGYSVTYPCDDYGHGTHVTGTGVGYDGGENHIGMAPGARWIGCRNMDSGVGRPSTYIECLQFFIAPTDLNGNNPNPDLRPDVISNSYGCPEIEECGAHSLQLALQAVRAGGIFMSVSAGNSGPTCETVIDPPALEASVFTIGAVDSGNAIASFSSRGPVILVDEVPLMKPELVAPGVGIRSSLRTSSTGYGYMQGTSMAAPHVAGAVALLWGAFPSLRRDVTATEDLLEQTAYPLLTLQGCGGDGPTQVPNNVFGWGLLDVKAAYDVYWTIQPKIIFPVIFKQN